MSKLSLYQLQPPVGGGFHFGVEGIEQERSQVVFPSDSLFAALVATVAEQEGGERAEAFVNQFHPESPPYRLTSLFPFAGQLPLLPTPRLPIQTSQPLRRKLAKDIRFVSPAIFKRLCQGKEMDDYLPPNDDESAGKGLFLQDGAIWVTAEEQAGLPANVLRGQKVWDDGAVPRVTLDRVNSASTIYQVGRITFNRECGLWLGVAFEDEGQKARLEELLVHLGDRGIGGERTNGYGAFTLITAEATSLRLDLPSEGNGYGVLLSRYLPRSQAEAAATLQVERASYRLVTTGGWLTSPTAQALRRKRIHLVAEGSVIGAAAPVHGRIEDVRPEEAALPERLRPFPHAIYRYGLALTVPVIATEPRTVLV